MLRWISPPSKEHTIAHPTRYYVEVRNNSGTTVEAGVTKHGAHEVVRLAAERNTGFRPLSGRKLF
jgi:hypothetical protein